MTVNGTPYHKSCFKCCHGGCTISPSNYIAHEGRLYCKHHHVQLIKEKGNLSQLEGDHAKDAVSENVTAATEFAAEIWCIEYWKLILVSCLLYLFSSMLLLFSFAWWSFHCSPKTHFACQTDEFLYIYIVEACGFIPCFLGFVVRLWMLKFMRCQNLFSFLCPSLRPLRFL